MSENKFSEYELSVKDKVSKLRYNLETIGMENISVYSDDEIITLAAERILLFYHLLEINGFNEETLNIFVNDIVVNWN